jgi:hypothetical protein
MKDFAEGKGGAWKMGKRCGAAMIGGCPGANVRTKEMKNEERTMKNEDPRRELGHS